MFSALFSFFLGAPVIQIQMLGFPSGSVVENPPANAGDSDMDSTPGLGILPIIGNGYLL